MDFSNRLNKRNWADGLLVAAIFPFAVAMWSAPSIAAEKIIGEPGSPSATTTIEGNQLPPMPDETFGGKIERNVLQSKPYWPPRVVPPEGAPNVCC